MADGRVLVPTADGQLFALDGGERRDPLAACRACSSRPGILGGASPAVAGGIVVAAYASGEVVALSLASGQQLWSDTVLRPRRTLAIGAIADIVGDPVIAGDRVFVAGASGEMAAFDLERGVREWTADVTSTQTPWVAGQLHLRAHRAQRAGLPGRPGRPDPLGEPARRAGRPRGPGLPPDPLDRARCWSSDRLLLASSEGEVVSVSPYTGEVLGRVELGGPVSVPPAVADGTVFFLTDGAELVAFR